MGANTKIEWTGPQGSTFNPWWGCDEVSAACDNCYARTFSARTGLKWGKEAERRFFSHQHWADPLKWNKKAEAEHHRPKVFCASMADVFEDRRDLDKERRRLWDLIDATPWLTWLLLTKRPHLMQRLAPDGWRNGWPENVWAMTTVENQTWANARIPHLMEVPAIVRGLSMEPLLGPVILPDEFLDLGDRGWVIAGGESGAFARPTRYEWVGDLLAQVTGPFFFKQWGEWLPERFGDNYEHRPTVEECLRVGKVKAGRLIHGEEFNQMPWTRPGDWDSYEEAWR